jgi:hypothetical protein
MATSSSSSKYDPNAIIASANERFHADGDLEGASLIYQSALLTWEDDARETSDPALPESVATLWLAYARFLSEAKQYKSSMEAYEQAVTPGSVARRSGRVWLEYARFALERNKPKTAQDVFVRALAPFSAGEDPDAVVAPPDLDEQDRQLLWSEFLEATRASTGNVALTLEELRAALHDQQRQQQQQQQQRSSTDAVDDASPDATLSLSSSLIPPPAKKPRLEESAGSAVDSGSTGPRTFVVTDDAVRSEAAGLADQLLSDDVRPLPDEIYGAWLLMDGTDDGAQISAPRALFQPSPPKLSDPAGKDLLGVSMALRLIRKISEPEAGDLLLEACRALWMLEAVVDQSAASRLERFDSATRAHATNLHANLRLRLSVSTAAAQRAVRMMNDSEWRAFEHAAGQQRQSLLAQTVWERRRLLCAQQTILAHMGVPGFEDGPAIDQPSVERQANVCAFLHSAFYLRARIGDGPHQTMLESQIKRLEKDLVEGATVGGGDSSIMSPGRSSGLSPHNRGMASRGGGGVGGGGGSARLSPMSLAAPSAYAYPPSLAENALVAPQLSYRAPSAPAVSHHHLTVMPNLPPPPRGLLPPTASAGGALPPPPATVGYAYSGAQQVAQPTPRHYPYGNYPP